ncbi:hypothetical protein DC522_19100 [Microvirga sp. KLBC 81]|nr:hypothetical protein DC522_19100 [Microvirga sp. KLBC 81]
MAAKHIASVTKNTRERVVVSLVQRSGQSMIDVRIYDRTGGQEFPSRNGFTLEPSLLQELRAAMDEAIAEAAREGLLP